MKGIVVYIICLIAAVSTTAQNRYELNSGWVAKKVNEVKETGYHLSKTSYPLENWLPATVPGTVLTTLLNNKLVPDPFYGMNNERIPDIYFTGNQFYTYWFVKDFKENASVNDQVWLQLRGVNYKAEIYLNGKKVNAAQHVGMLLRQQYNITSLLSKDGNNRLAILVYPPDHPGNPNGGQGGDGTIAKDLTTQYTAGWDWIQPMRDRNTGIWDKVTIEKTKGINIGNPHVVTIVPGKRLPEGKQEPAFIRISAELENPTSTPVVGVLKYQLQGKTIQQKVTIPANTTIELSLPQLTVTDPKLWWPNGYGKQNLYDLKLQFVTTAGIVTDEELLQFGIRQIDNKWNEHTRSMQAFVNGQPIFIKGGNWIISDAMLRFSEERYDAEIRFHRDMNLNLIRVWGGALTERPEFYAACDKYGLLVFQDFWFSGDCNGRWKDPMKKEDQWMRRKYPDNHQLALKTAADQIKLIRNHPSLAFWCGGNEITPPDDILIPLKDSLLPKLDGTRYFFDYSNSDSMSYNSIGGNGDGPYTIQDDKTFWTVKTFPYNSEVGSVGVGDYASLMRFIPKENLVAPQVSGKADSVWEYHRYIPYNQYTEAYGATTGAKDFTMKAQLVNYNQYRSLMEGFSSHMWDWYTGTIIWKTQNPWAALRGQMYDYYLDVNACLYGLRTGSKPLHIMMNPADQMVMLVNNGFQRERNLMIEVKVVDVITGKDSLYTLLFNEIGPSVSQKLFSIAGFLSSLNQKDGIFVLLRLKREDQSLADENFYWLPGTDGNYTALQQMPLSPLSISAIKKANGRIEVELSNKHNQPVAFFNRIALVDQETGQRILPAFFSDNYVSVMPGESKKIIIEYPPKKEKTKMKVQVYGWNVPETEIEIK
ncbi:MAG: glycoside hydrolase family 2 TIM barrel-domain containing protein [Chitinophagaceae bacterium]